MAEARGGVRVTFVDAAGKTIAEGVVPADLPVDRVLLSALARSQLPLRGPDGNPVRYGLVHREGAGRLRDQDTLSGAGVRDGDHLLVRADPVAVRDEAAAVRAAVTGGSGAAGGAGLRSCALVGIGVVVGGLLLIGLYETVLDLRRAYEPNDPATSAALSPAGTTAPLPQEQEPEESTAREDEPAGNAREGERAGPASERGTERPSPTGANGGAPRRAPSPDPRVRERFAAVDRALEARRTEEARALLEATPPSERNWEWHHLSRLADGLPPFVIPTADSWVVSLAFSPDGGRLASGSHEQQRDARGNAVGGPGVVRWWDPTTGRALGCVRCGHYMLRVAVLPGGRQAITANESARSILRLWDTATYEELRQFPTDHSYGITALSVRHDATQVATASFDGTVKIWDLATGREVRAFDCGKQVLGVAFSPDGRHLAAGGHDRVVRLWGLTPAGGDWTLPGHTNLVQAVAFDPAGGRLASGGLDGSVRLWDVDTGEVLGVLRGGGEIHGIAFSPDGTHLAATSGGGKVRVWDTTTGECVRTLSSGATKHSCMSVAWSPDDRFLAAGRSDGVVALWGAVEKR